MRVVFNALSSYRLRTGVGSYAAHLAAELRALAGNAITAFPEGWRAPFASLAGRVTASKSPKAPAGSQFLPSSLRGMIRHGLKRFCERSFQRACRGGGFDLYHEPNFIPWECDLPTVVTAHDLSVVNHPEWHPPERVAVHAKRFAAALARSRHVLTVSEAMRREIIATMGVSPERITTVPNGVRPDMREMAETRIAPVRAKLGLPPRYLLYVGTIEPRKNVLTLLRAYCALDESLRSRCPLVLAGPWGWGYERELSYLHSTARHRGVMHLGYVPDAELPAVYAGAAALAYPSHYEGFGLPPIEMMACGGAVLASTAAAVREVCGTHAHFLHPDDEPGWRDAMGRLIAEPEWCDELRRGATEHAHNYSWRRCATETWRVYQQVVGSAATTRKAA